jgi:hypothetical protein
MTSSRHHISKVLLLLAAVLAPLQQSLAASCCCRQDSASETSSCSGGTSSCCAKEADATASCCEDRQNDESVQCHCPSGSCRQDNPTTAEPPVASGNLNEGELVQLESASHSAGEAKPVSTAGLVTTEALKSLCSIDRCVLLCRFVL